MTARLRVLTVAGALAIAGCGGGGGGKTRGYAETGKVLDGICTRLDANAQSLGSKLNRDAKHDAPILDKFVDLAQKARDDIAAVKPDPKLKAAMDAYVAKVDAGLAHLKKLRDTAHAGDNAAYQAALRQPSPNAKSEARALGATVCAAQG